MASGIRKSAELIIRRSNTQDEMIAELNEYVAGAKAHTDQAAKFQEAVLHEIQKIAIENGQIAGGPPSLGAHIMVQQHHKIAQYGKRAFCLSEKQMAVIVREEWDWLKPTEKLPIKGLS